MNGTQKKNFIVVRRLGKGREVLKDTRAIVKEIRPLRRGASRSNRACRQAFARPLDKLVQKIDSLFQNIQGRDSVLVPCLQTRGCTRLVRYPATGQILNGSPTPLSDLGVSRMAVGPNHGVQDSHVGISKIPLPRLLKRDRKDAAVRFQPATKFPFGLQ